MFALKFQGVTVSMVMKVSDIIMHVMKIIWWGLEIILSSRSRDIEKSAKNQNLE